MILIWLIASSVPPAEVWPGATWEAREPAELGLDAAALQRFSELVGGRGCVVRGGYLAYTWGDAAARGDVASAAKPVYAHFLFAALEAGRVASLDEPVVAHEPRLAGVDRDITWRHLATQTSCYGLTEAPGTAYCYNDWQMALFWDLLFTRVYGATPESIDERVLRPMLADRIGCEDAPTMLAFGPGDRPGRLGISPRDFARFGLLYLRGGRWRGEQLIATATARRAVTEPLPPSFPRAGTEPVPMLPGQRTIGSRNVPDNQTDHLGSYSWLWWTNGVDRDGLRHWPAAPKDTYGCFGHGGRRAMVVIPSLDLVASWNDTNIEGLEPEQRALAALVAAARPAPPPGTVMVDPARPSRLIRWPDRPLYLCGPGDPEDFLYRADDQEAIIDAVAAAGANTLYLQVVRSHGGDGDATHNPFIDHDPGRGLDPAVLARWDGWLARMNAAGIVPLVFLYDDSTRIWNTGDEVGAGEAAFVTAMVERFRRHELLWCIAEEYQEALRPARVSALAALIRRLDPWHPVAVHKLHGSDFAEFANDPTIDLFAMQYNEADPHRLRSAVETAVGEAEGRYHVILSECADMGSGAELEAKLRLAAESGASVMVLGMDVVNTPPDDLAACGRLRREQER